MRKPLLTSVRRRAAVLLAGGVLGGSAILAGPASPAQAACTISNVSSDILYVYSQPNAGGFALGYLWPGGGRGSSAPCYGGTYQNVQGTWYTACGGGDVYDIVSYNGSPGYVPTRCTQLTY
jgi:hypothetical protein